MLTGQPLTFKDWISIDKDLTSAAGSAMDIICLLYTSQGRSRVKSYKVHQIEAVPREEWVEVAGTHEAIIDYETFDKEMCIRDREVYREINYTGT